VDFGIEEEREKVLKSREMTNNARNQFGYDCSIAQ